MESFEPTGRRRIRPWVALRSFLQAVRDPDDTQAGARFVLALAGNAPERHFERFRSDPLGARILEERRHLLESLLDRATLRALPADTLGRAYLDFVESQNLSADGLAQLVEEADPGGRVLDPDRQLLADRLRDMHDLWHVVTGYSRDLIGELLLIAFTAVQVPTPAFRIIVPLGYLLNELRMPGTRALIRGARRRAREAVWLPAQDWEALLERPLDEVRDVLRVGPPPVYTPYWSAGAPAVSGEAA